MIAFCKQCGKRYRIDVSIINGSNARFNCRYCGALISAEWHEDTPDVSKTIDGNSLNSPQSEFEEVNYSIKNRSAIEPTSGSPKGTLLSKITKGYRLTLVTKVIVLMLFVSFVPFCTVNWFILREITTQIRRDTENLIEQVASDLVINVNEWIDKNIRVLRTLSDLDGMISMDPYHQTPLLKTIQKQYPWMYLVVVTDIRGKNTSRSDEKPLIDYSDQQYYKDIMAGNDMAWQVVTGKKSKKPTLVLAVPIIRDGLTIGMLANEMTIDSISTTVANWKRGNSGYAFLVDETGKVVSCQRENILHNHNDLSSHPLVKKFAEGRVGTLYFKDENNIPLVGNVHGTRYGWALCVQQRVDEALQPIKRVRWFVVQFFILYLFIVILISWLVGRAIVLPIKKLTEATERISVGELDVKIKISTDDEIADLGRAIVRMQNSIRLSIERIRQKKH